MRTGHTTHIRQRFDLPEVWKRQSRDEFRIMSGRYLARPTSYEARAARRAVAVGPASYVPPAVSRVPSTSDYVPVGGSLYFLRRATPDDLGDVRRLFEEAADWLRRNKDTDQWETPWPDGESWIERARQDLREHKTWLVWDGTLAIATITLDTKEPVDTRNRPVWPAHKRHELALYVRRVIVSRSYAGLGLGAGLLDWASNVAMREHGASLIRIDVWTTNLELHEYYTGQRFVRLKDRQPWELAGYPSQALFERSADRAGSGFAELFTEEDEPGGDGPLYRSASNIGYIR